MKKGGRNIGLFQKLFGRKSGDLPQACAYVDFEHWYISMENIHRTRPDIKAWHNELMKSYDVRNVVFFADFSNIKLKNEIANIRQITNSIIDTQNSGHYKKDYTDFIMLDYIYQNAVDNSNVDVHIIFTGDGHFSSVVKFLTNKLRKKVVIYGVSGAFSSHLKAAATECRELPDENEQNKYYKIIVDNFKFIRDQKQKRIIPTFMSTVETLSVQHEIPQEKIKETLSKMIDENYILKKEKKMARGQSVKVLEANWKKIKKDRIG